MKFAISSEHRDFFQKQRTIEFEGLLSPAQLAQFVPSFEEALAERLEESVVDIHQITPGKLFMAGHDLWRESPQVKKIVMQKQLAEVASELVEIKPIRIGYDQLFPELRGRTYQSSVSDAYHQLLNTHLTLNGISSIEGILCGLMLCLKGDGTGTAEPGTIFSKMPGSGVFFAPEAPLDFQHILQNPLHRYLMIVYVRKSAFYQVNEQDPHTYTLKHMGFTFGQMLTDKSNPIILR